MSEHAVLVWLRLAGDGFGDEDEWEAITALEDRLQEIVCQQGVGEFDGNEIGMGYWTLYLYGPDADRLYDAILPAIQGIGPRPGSYAIKRYGPPDDPDSREERALL
ncbi:MAG: hypothetical protein HY331_12265 [Chloroflexi bacterium]|nr:hypothetical protein [Chloroflexota bacterium]